MSSASDLRWVDRSTFQQDSRESYLRIQSISIFVQDQEKSLHFYVDKLGFRLIHDARVNGTSEGWVALAPPDGTALIALITPTRDSPEYERIGQSSGIVLITEDVQGKFQEWSERGVRFQHPPMTPSWGGVFTSFEDIDGNRFSLVGFDEVNREIEAQRQAIAESLEAERRMAQELEIARPVQARLFPQVLPSLRTLEYSGICLQAREVGGDYYDFLDLGHERIAFVIGDVSGKGIAAALMMANLQANLRSQCVIAGDDPERLLRSVNHLFYNNTSQSAYATLIFAEYDDRAQMLRYANCGHLSGLLLREDGRLERLDSTGTVLGLFKDWDCTVAEHQLFPGDTLVLYTDGVTECSNDAGEEFGETRLIEAIMRGRELSHSELLAGIVDELRKFSGREQQDDITIIAARCRSTFARVDYGNEDRTGVDWTGDYFPNENWRPAPAE